MMTEREIDLLSGAMLKFLGDGVGPPFLITNGSLAMLVQHFADALRAPLKALGAVPVELQQDSLLVHMEAHAEAARGQMLSHVKTPEYGFSPRFQSHPVLTEESARGLIALKPPHPGF